MARDQGLAATSDNFDRHGAGERKAHASDIDRRLPRGDIGRLWRWDSHSGGVCLTGRELVTAVRVRIDVLDAELASQTPTMESIRSYWDRRLEARVDFLEALEALDPPEEAVELHGVVVGLIGSFTAAEEALATRVAAFETATTPSEWWTTPEGLEARAFDEETTEICLVAQTEFDSTKDQDVLADVPWISSDLTEVVSVFLGCDR